MLRSYFLIALRILWRDNLTSFISIFSLAIGIMAFLLIMLYVHHEYSYDKFNKNYNRIFRLESEEYARLPSKIYSELKGKIPEIETITQVSPTDVAYIYYIPAKNPDNRKEIFIEGGIWADSTVFKVFTLPFVKGNPKNALDDPFSVVLTENVTNKLFNNQDPIGKTVDFWGHPFTVTGIINDVKRSHIKIDAMFSVESLRKIITYSDHDQAEWLWHGTYLITNDINDPGLVEAKINNVLSDLVNSNYFWEDFKRFKINPLKDIYFKGSAPNAQYGMHGNLQMVNVLIIIAFFILILAVVNYINLATARSMLRSKEVILKKNYGFIEGFAHWPICNRVDDCIDNFFYNIFNPDPGIDPVF